MGFTGAHVLHKFDVFILALYLLYHGCALLKYRCKAPFFIFISLMTREFTLRMDSDHYVEEGFLTKTSLAALLNHAVHNCPRLEKVVGEWTKVGKFGLKDF